ncbi:helix-turn-helix domain-containing protein [Lawsonibacter faecis]|uniref:helix-turn-helix domain-containing protein n=1 Tax=Lawsonibacter faecis TaxID=2763052 RepID=UPI0012BCA42A|nr:MULTISPECIES: helix-turn-helix transcriptional regulator [Oscillospiraceae]MTQ98742.1 helix-turn-helix domain-containing protein [Pseudoflavonifractor sp. BIOML-A16]MTR06653.1 helix-turn-helix domain-containing protein [Pseudoflavonifractor sp. BIOML-A15]MTR34245.1 helix-turn-helix domain-containing protein [Pseudoflavonifractor sp. BIOML-A14]MTR74903.1 helix-turn-helix domain-containing protein [Pseudoflavonifractor sp. BIOML-A18]MTS64585.1 helix-turn-helix domain-containing protein [Pseud
MTLGQKIKEARLSRGMTQKELVGDAITRNMLSKIENDSAAPSMRTLEYLAGALGLPAGYFLDQAPISDGTVPDGLDEARAAYRQRRWSDCLAALEADSRAGTSDEGYLLHAHAGAYAAREALDAGQFAAARELAETAQYYNQEGLYMSSHLAAQLALILGECLTRMGEEGYESQRAAFLRAFEALEAQHKIL